MEKHNIAERLLLLEEFGIDERFIKRIGLTQEYSTGMKNKQSVKVYIPKHEIELYQVMALFFQLQSVSISAWMRNQLKDYARKLAKDNNFDFNQAKEFHREIKESQFIKLETFKKELDGN